MVQWAASEAVGRRSDLLGSTLTALIQLLSDEESNVQRATVKRQIVFYAMCKQPHH